jgi:hypothetical protein
MPGKPWLPNLEFVRFRNGWGIAASIWLPVAANAAFAAWLFVDLGLIQGSFYANSDNSSALVLAELLDERGSGDAVLGAASDAIFLIGGVLPFVCAVGLGWWLRLLSRGVAILAATASLAGTGAGLLLAEIAKDAGIRPSGLSFPIASPGHALDNVQRLVEAVALFMHGRLGDAANPGNTSIPDGFDRILVIGTAPSSSCNARVTMSAE